MPNNNTISQALTAAGGRLPSDAGGASSTAEFQFSKSSSRFIARMPGSDRFKERPFKVKVWGRVTGGTTTNFTVNLDHGTSATISSNTTIATSGAIAVNSESGNFLLEAICLWDDTSDKLQGSFNGWINNTAVAVTVNTEVGTVDLVDEDDGFTVTGTFSASNASNAAILDGFEVEAI